MSKIKPVEIFRSLAMHIDDKDCVEIVDYLLDIVQKPSTIFKIEELVKTVAMLERTGV